MAELNRLPPDAAPDDAAAAIARDGYVIIERLAVDTAAKAQAELGPHIEAAPYGHTEFLGARTKRLGSLFRRSTAAQALAIHPKVLAIADRVLLPHCARYQLNFSGIMHLEPGAGAQALHRDGILYPFLHPCPPTLMPAMWAITDFTAENGGTQIVPGSHLWEHDREPMEEEVGYAAMPSGSVLIYTSGIIHGGGTNQSNSLRTGMALQYSLGWLRQEENQYLASPPEVARTYPERLQRLIGYDYGGPYLGFYNGDDPHRVFEPDYKGPAERTSPEIEEAAARIEWLRWGDIKPVPTPRGMGTKRAIKARSPGQ
jgi:ectoine hydroxylase-related dioxygenase (phytanoyl-CoA dioxygenase family)